MYACACALISSFIHFFFNSFIFFVRSDGRLVTWSVDQSGECSCINSLVSLCMHGHMPANDAGKRASIVNHPFSFLNEALCNFFPISYDTRQTHNVARTSPRRRRDVSTSPGRPGDVVCLLGMFDHCVKVW